ncbi:MAG: ElyC/SanA/YdcF family protein [Cyanobacteria bacterium P01_H01_bin.121]
MFDLLTQGLLWVLLAVFGYYLLSKIIRPSFYTALGFIVFLTLIVLAFVEPNQGVVGEAWSILSLPLRPLGLALLLLGITMDWTSVWKVAGLKSTLTWIFLLLWISSMPVLAYWLANQMETQVYNRVEETLGDTAPVVVLLANDTTQPNIPPRTQVELTAEGDRIRYAASIVRNEPGVSTVIVSAGERGDLSGGEEVDREEARDVAIVLIEEILGNATSPELLRDIDEVVKDPARPLILPDTKRTTIIIDKDSNSIYQSAEATRGILGNENYGLQGVRSIYLVTSALEALRATATFEQSLDTLDRFTVIPRIASFLTIQTVEQQPTKTVQVTDALPDATALAQTSRIIEEQLISVYYFLRGWLAST